MRKKSSTQEPIQTLQEGLRGHPLEAIIRLALVTGMRLDELLHLTWQKIDLEEYELCICHAKTKKGS